MLMYHLTITADAGEIDRAEIWIKDIFLNTIQKEKEFMAYKLLELISEKEHEGKTFSLQVYFDEYKPLQKFLGTTEPQLLKNLRETFGEKVMEFRTLLRVLDTGINE